MKVIKKFVQNDCNSLRRQGLSTQEDPMDSKYMKQSEKPLLRGILNKHILAQNEENDSSLADMKNWNIIEEDDPSPFVNA